MKKILLISTIIFIFLNAYSQTQITLTFLGIDSVGQSPVLLDSVLVNNLDGNCDTLLFGPNPVLLLIPVIPELIGETGTKGSETLVLEQNYPNPFQGSANVSIYKGYRGPLKLILYDLSGIKLAEFHNELGKGVHSFSVSSSGERVLLLVASDDKNYRTIKMVCKGQSYGSSAISLRDISLQTEKSSSAAPDNTGFIFYPGDQLMYTAYANGYHDNTIFDAPVTSTEYTFNMVNLATPVTPTVSTAEATFIMQTTATSGGTVSSDGGAAVTERGVCWNTTQNPTTDDSHTIDGAGTGEFESYLNGLTANTLYYTRAYATNSAGTAYGNEVTFATLPNPVLATITTSSVTNIAYTTATSGGEVISDGGAPVTARGVCWNTSPNPTISDSHTSNGSGLGVFVSNLTGLSPNTPYYIRAYATNSVGVAYGNELTFTTLALTLPEVTTAEVTNIWDTSATSGGTVTFDGGADVTARGVCWNTTQNPTITNDHTSDGSGTGIFISDMTGLTGQTVYYVRAYATNSVGTSYGSELTFTTLNIPTLTTTIVTEITSITATSGGTVTSDGGRNIIARGVCWSVSPSPTTADSHTSDGAGLGTFTSMVSWLLANTVYYIRAFAINDVGVAYGNELTFTTLPPAIPLVSTFVVTDCFQTTATGGGWVVSDSGATVNARGVCWSISSNPTITDSHTTDGNGSGTFTSTLIDLSPNSQYYVRAYATNSAGTAYGNEVTFNNTYYIGKSFGGGIVFYVDDTYSHGIISAASDQSAGAMWGCYGTLVGASGTAIGTGQANTTAIVNGCPTTGIAARICDDLVLNGYSDWFLPSLWELGRMSDYQGFIGGFNGGTYWSSSEYDAWNADFMVFTTSTGYFYTKPGYEKVRAVRAF